MKQSDIKKLLLMIASEDENPDTFEFVLKRIMGIINGIESETRGSKSQ